MFDRVEDVIDYLCDSIFQEIKTEISLHSYSTSKDLLLNFISQWMKHEMLLEGLVENGLMNSLIDSHIEMKELIESLIPGKKILKEGNGLYMLSVGVHNAYSIECMGET